MKNQTSIGIDIGGTSIKYGIVNQVGTVLWEHKRPTKASTSRQEVEQNIIAAALEAKVQAEELGLNIEVIGIGTPGLVNKQGIVLGGADNIKGWENVPLSQFVQKALTIPTFAGNDADMMAVGEVNVAGHNAVTAIFITLGTGIGGAMIINGQLFSGHFGLGGELGVFPMVIDGKVQNWEEVASTTAMVRKYQMQCSNKTIKIDGKYIVRQYLSKEVLATEVMNETTHLIGMGIAGYINIFNPEMVIIGGGISDAGDFFIAKIKAHLPKYTLQPCLRNVQVIRANLGNRAGFIGAGIYGLKQLNLSSK